MFYEWGWVRRAIGGKWGRVTGWIFGKRWVRLPKESLEWHEFWVSVPQGVCAECGCHEDGARLWGGHRKDCRQRIPF